MRLRNWWASAAVVALAGAGSPALAQADTEVETVIVTAQKREQNLQDVPIVVTVVTGEQLQDAGVKDVKDLQVLAPGLSVTSSTGGAQTSIRIRGVGTIGDNPGLESSVGTVIDGVYRARSGVAFNDLGEVERIEVLKGPQGTVFGKNTSAGVINVITALPQFEFGGAAELTAGNYDAKGASISLTGPLSETLAGRIFAAKRVREGFYDVRNGAGPSRQPDNDDQDVWTVRGQLLWRASETLTLRFLADFTQRDEHCCLNVITIPGPTAAIIDALAADEGLLRPADPFRRLAHANRESNQQIEDKGLSLQADWEISDDITLTSITAWRDWLNRQANDIDFSSADIWYRPEDGRTFSEFEVFSQELRVAGVAGPLDWMVGGFFSDERLKTSAFTPYGTSYETYFSLLLSQGASPTAVSALTGLPAGTNYRPGEGAYDRFDHESRGWALFTNNTWHVSEALEVTFGLRYTSDTKDVFAQYRNTAPGAACAAAIVRPIPAAARAALCAPGSDPAFDNADTRQERTEERLGGTVKVSYRFNPDLMAYVSYASSHKSGGFNLDRARFAPGVINPDTSFPAETVDAYEVGAKSQLFDNALILNAAAFHQTFENFQLNTFTGISFVVASIPEVTSKGVDLDAVWRTPIHGLTFTGGATYAVTQYGDFVPGAGVGPRLPGSRLSYAPLWSVSWSGAYEREMGSNLKLRASLSGRYTSAYNTGSNLDPLKIQKELTLWNGRIGVGAADDRWTLELFAQNLTDEDYYQVVVDQPLQSGTFAAFLGAPRTWGVTLRSRF
ncbi:TonB-dependent receptor [Phenylobacterium sp.]|jgi:outer membrane receptor protein involved in Fe transport|uniref:TonB-dependent receptor n=1 Tax=Phenylobacterium sp. TaxID=1871053 RepID=UPI002E2FA35A|nr:TonB-dependent receptor [Phenylobacterium sp.]HEX2558605.1 TonB-dependent receptor [Phenylobacterium sp.]